MANGYTNTVPLGQVGTGAAYVLGPNMALQQWMGAVQQDNQQRQVERRDAKRQQQANFRDFNQRMAQFQPSSSMYRDDVNELLSQHMQKGAALMAQGKNPYNPNYNDPEAIRESQEFLKEENNIKVVQSVIADTAKQRDAYLKEWNDDKNAFDYESYLRIQNFEQENSIADLIEGRAQIPGLERSFDMGSFVKSNVPTPSVQIQDYERDEKGKIKLNPDGTSVLRSENQPDIEKITDNVMTAFQSGSGRNYLNRKLREAGVQGDATGLIGSTDEDEVRQQLDEWYRSPAPGNPAGELIYEGRIPALDTPEYERFLDDSVREQLRAERAAFPVLNQAVQRAVGAVDPKMSMKANFDYQKELSRQNREKRDAARLALAQSNARRRASSGSSDRDVTYSGDDLVPVGSDSRGNAGMVPVQNGINFYNTAVTMTGGGAYNMNRRENQRDTPSISGQLVKLGEYPFDRSTGLLLSEEEASTNPNVEYRKMAQVRQSDGGVTSDLLVPASKIPSTLPASKQKIVNDFLSRRSQQTQTRPSTGTNIKASQSTIDLFK